jgi:hypothetical protein
MVPGHDPARALLARIRPRDTAGKARRRVTAELISDLERSCQRKKAASKNSIPCRRTSAPP